MPLLLVTQLVSVYRLTVLCLIDRSVSHQIETMSDQKEIYQLLQLLRKERQNQSEKARLAKRLESLRDENLRLLTEIGHCRNNVENLRKLLANDDQKAYHHYIHQREKMLHQRQQLREKRADQRKLVDELDQRFERLQLATFPVFS